MMRSLIAKVNKSINHKELRYNTITKTFEEEFVISLIIV